MDTLTSTDIDLDGIDLEEFLAHPHWEVMDSEPDALTRQLPKRATKFWRTIGSTGMPKAMHSRAMSWPMG